MLSTNSLSKICLTSILYFYLMRDIEYKVIRFLIFIGLLFVNYHLLLIFTSFIAPEGFLNDVRRIGGFFINLLGLHALFAFGTFFYSRMYLNMKD